MDYKNNYLKITKNKFTDSFKNILKLLTGNILSQFLTLIFAPILSRLYGPQAYGVIALYLSLINLLDIFTTFRYELAITIPEKEMDAIHIVRLCFFITLITSLISLLIIIICHDSIIIKFNLTINNSILFLIPASLFINGITKALMYFSIRKRKFNTLAKIKVSQNLISNFTKIFFYKKGEIGLIFGQLAEKITFSATILKKNKNLFCNGIGLNKIIKKAFTYKDFGTLSSLTQVFNSLSLELPILILANRFGSSELGIFYLVQRLILMPTGLISESTSQVFLSDISEEKDKKKCIQLFNSYSKYLFIFAIIYCVIIFVSSPLIPILLGPEWNDSTKIACAIAPLAFSQIFLVPLGSAYEGKRLISKGLMAQIILFIFKNIPLIIVINILNYNLEKVIWCYSFAGLIGYTIYFLILNNSIKNNKYLT